MTATMLMRDMTDNERLLFQTRLARDEKSPTTALILTLVLGGLGAHRFYLGQIGWGVTYLVFCWTFIPAIVSFFELFVITGRTRDSNEARAREIAAEMALLRGSAGLVAPA
jgi:hypothetical protein